MQLDRATNVRRRRDEGHSIGDRLGQNVPVPYTFKCVQTTFNKMLGSHQLEWTAEKAQPARMAVDVKQCLESLRTGPG